MKTMRLFIAISLSHEMQKQLHKSWRSLSLPYASLRPTPPENLHITLKFIGETDVSALPAMVACLDDIAQRSEPFDIATGSGIVLPMKRPNVIGVRIEPSESLNTMVRHIETSLAEQGLARPSFRSLQAHITCARVTDGLVQDEERIKISSWHPNIEWTVDGFELFESILRPQGPLYQPLNSFLFG